jgi:type IV pilus assembly protein PilP
MDTIQIRRTKLLLLGLLAGLVYLGCDDGPPPPQPKAAPAKPAAPPPKPAAATPEQAEVAEPELTEHDFIERVDNRDPFRSFVVQSKGPRQPVRLDQRKVLMKRFALDELKLVAVVTGPNVRPLAMFTDPTGLGVSVKRGDYISKGMSRIKQILDDKVIVEIEERSEDEKTRSERVIDMHSERGSK